MQVLSFVKLITSMSLVTGLYPISTLKVVTERSDVIKQYLGCHLMTMHEIETDTVDNVLQKICILVLLHVKNIVLIFSKFLE